MRSVNRQIYVTLLLLTIGTSLSWGQIEYTPSPYSRDAIQALTGVAQMLVSDAFHPMAQVSEGDTEFTASPIVFAIDETGREPYVEADQIRGIALGAGLGHALSDRLIVYGAFAAFRISGTARLQPIIDSDLSLDSDVRYTHLALLGGMGYELVDRPRLAIPVFAGPILHYFSAEIEPDETSIDVAPIDFGLPEGSPISASLSVDINGSGALFGFSGGIASAITVADRFRITPYLIGFAAVNRPRISAEATVTPQGVPVQGQSVSREFTLDPVLAAMFGIDVGFRASSGWSVSVALGDLLASITGVGTSQTAEGIVVRPIVLIVSYSRT